MATLDLTETADSFQAMIDEWDKFVPINGTPTEILMTKEDFLKLYPSERNYSAGPRHWRGIPITIKEED